MRIIVTGSRKWTDRQKVWNALAAALDYHEGPITVVHGDCPTGADRFAREWCALPSDPGDFEVTEERHPADWNLWGKSAGPRRNVQMVQLGADLVLAFPLGDSPGTRHCMRYAQSAGIPVEVVES